MTSASPADSPADPSASGATRFAAAELARRFDEDVHCTTRKCSVRDAGWSSVLVRVAQRQDASGRADMGVLPHLRIMLVTRGTVAVQRRDGATRRSAHLAPGKAWLVPAGVPLSYEWTGAGCGIRELSVLVIPGDELERTAEVLNRRRSAPVTFTAPVLTEDHVVRSALTGLTHALAAGVDELYAQTSAAFLLAHVLSHYGNGSAGPVGMGGVDGGREDSRVRTAIEFMRDNLHLPVSLSDLAGSAGLSPYHFVRVFHASTGQPPRRFLTRMRIEVARRRLADSDLTVTEIADLCGFSSASQFSTAFRRETGMAPRAFRHSRAA
ncbi:AraC family transcriptional regulator [Frankia sp. AiPs1]|uniref:helix-turn-helix domain-containing protein n=1 Tax=Frankia sp. AiPs1 TaxID=573493 RepID=UPI002044137A|nr:AraC family transcriptional regulator [Frankia sp. AiPs1]MCM3923573.1 AraC family transcriptional regulator [Frankia sp. AiPs1]